MGKGKLPLGSLALGEKEGGNGPGGQEENIPEPSGLGLQTLFCVTLTSLILKSYKCQEGGCRAVPGGDNLRCRTNF